MQFGVNTLIWSVHPDPAVVPFGKLREAGVDGIELPLFDPASFDAAAVRRAVDEHGMRVNFCSINPPGGNPISDVADERAAALDHWKTVIALAAETGAEILAGPSFAPVGWLPGRRRSDDEWKRAVEFHQQLDAPLAEAGIELAIEPLNRFETFFLNTAPDAVRLCDEIASPRIGILLDTFHSNIEDKSVPAAYRLCRKHLKHVHTCENDRGVPGSGHVDWIETLRSLREIGYDRWMTIESFNAAMPELSAATAIWRDLAPSTDDIAVVGTRFLRELYSSLEH